MCVFDGPQPSQLHDPWQQFVTIDPTAGWLKDDPANWKRLTERDGYKEVYAMAQLSYAVLPDEMPKKGGADAKSCWASLGMQDARFVLFSFSLLPRKDHLCGFIPQRAVWVHHGKRIHTNSH